MELPSGLSNFYTLQTFPLGAEKQVGPFTPEVLFDGNIADDEYVQGCIRELVRSGR